MKLKIISKGVGAETYVINEETGERVEGVTYINWCVAPDKQAVATIELHNVPAELEGFRLGVSEKEASR